MPLSPVSTISSRPPVSSRNDTILSKLKSGQRVILDPNCLGGLIIVKSFYADFAGPGAAVGGEFDRHCTAVYTVGTVRFRQPKTSTDREESLYTRLAYAERLANITHLLVPLRRGGLILEQLGQWLSPDLAQHIPADLVCQLVGIAPETLKLTRHASKQQAEDRSVATHSPFSLQSATLQAV